MNAHLNLVGSPVAASSLKQIIGAAKALKDSTLPAATIALVEIRASQINGRGACTNIHTKAAHPGIPPPVSTGSRPGGRSWCSPTPSAPPWN
ncbi:hypothetical protein GCM10022225_79620 [Plantactinospora mayteni]|uniref:Carboxymuconolactone decarboxylase-like domain-containing protein n=1 Tax=Plantactinospora mayteni TaxID=566021 RepID=A0ABQ4F3E8_9ACTN|nr:carboxymuconolactone decarboxylase family protein [Plantactinospora mayteni]GIH01418.1 hypothetical protein Pma05_79900 [Plantactinospora mayteni]